MDGLDFLLGPTREPQESSERKGTRRGLTLSMKILLGTVTQSFHSYILHTPEMAIMCTAHLLGSVSRSKLGNTEKFRSRRTNNYAEARI